MRNFLIVSDKFKTPITITMSYDEFDSVIFGYGLFRGEFKESEELVIDELSYENGSVTILGNIYEKAIN